MPYEINREKFAEGPSLVEVYQSAKEIPMPKLNVKIRTSDLRILDSISRQSGTPRSQILNSMIESVIVAMIQDLAKDDPDCAALVAKQADAIGGTEYMSKGSWSDMLFEGVNPKLDHYYAIELPDRKRLGGLSDEYRTIAERFSRANG
ncbi:hypothetical protein [Luteimonas sp. MC1825]|uniref:hypothetical protein n=1 Tax=Luteimonas sp. MC1825 TaxID=2761107 RepID=UPI001615C352|nr:hypothetical protein [Luteimonas sp. MC1825]MBB6600322.1 hypothetical protein [Luteimonas sp. MC1825]QOC88000.1 hypothetical protein IDM46_12395 [Luteimonas sp. MC1825]